MEKLRFILEFFYDRSFKGWGEFKRNHRILVKRGDIYKFEYWGNLRWF